MNYFDLHCDTLFYIARNGGTLAAARGHLNLKRLRRFKKAAQVFALFTESTLCSADAYKEARYMCELFSEQAESCRTVKCKTAAEVEKAVENGHTAAMLSIENAAPLGEAGAVEFFAGAGVRIAGLVHNGDNEYAGSAVGDPGRGLTDKGKELISKLEYYGIAVDISHLNFKSAAETITYAKHPVATHSDSYAVWQNPRNLTDELAAALAEKGGICGVNLHRPFVGGSCKKLCEHVDRLIDAGGEEFVAFGCDFDGTDELCEDIKKVGDMRKIADNLKKVGYNKSTIEKICFDNAMNFFKRLEK